MKYSNEQINEKLKSICMQDMRTKKPFYSLKDVFKEFGLKNFEVGIIATTSIFKKMDDLSYPCKNNRQLKTTAAGIVEDVYLSPLGLMLVLATASQMLKDKNNQEVCMDIALLLKQDLTMFYPDRRFFYREEFKENFKLLSSRVKQIVDGDNYRSVSGHLSRLHYTIISEYYGVSDLNTITYEKTGTFNKNYLDYISLRELKDLSEIQRNIIKEIEKNPGVDFISLARYEATEKRRNFFFNYAGKYPLEYRAHSNTPKKMILQYDKLLKELNLVPNTKSKTNNNEKTPL